MNDASKRTCCFTGHRKLSEAKLDAIESQAEAHIRDLYDNGVRFFRVGGAVGFDTMMAQLLFRLRASDLSDIKVSLFYPFDGFTDGWTDAEKALYADLLPKYDEVYRVCDKSGSSAYLARDRALVDGSAYCIAYCRNIRARSGTAYTVRYALNGGVEVCNFAVDKTETTIFE